jgi:hypothetical protein
MGTGGWRWIFWLQAIFHGLTSLGLFFFYWPPKNIEYPNMSFKDYVWACDPFGSLLFISGATLTLLAMDWAGGAYGWSNPHVVAPLTLGLLLLVGFGIYGKPSHHPRTYFYGFVFRVLLTTDMRARMERTLRRSGGTRLLPQQCQLRLGRLCIRR